MDASRIRAALSDLEHELERARGVKTQIENEATGRPTEGGSYEDPQAALGTILWRMHEVLLVVLEAAGLPDTRSRLVEKWAQFEKEKEIGRATYDEQYDYVESKPYEYLSVLLDGLRGASGDDRSPSDSFELAQLETILRRTPVLVHRRGKVPARELDVQEVMHDYLEAFFIQYKHPLKIPGIVRDFEPDGGVRNLGAAIEFKFAATRAEVSHALGGIFEDVSGYAGSRDWTRFYSVIYQTAPFESEDRIRSEFTRAGAITWKAILVTGVGQRAGSRKRRR